MSTELQGFTPGQNTEKILVHIRWMIRRDMLEVLDIESNSFEFPWRDEDFIRCLRQRNCIGTVAEYNNRVVGFMVYELNKTKIHILNFAVDHRFRRLGVGTQLMAKQIEKLATKSRERITLEVRETNLSGQLFFRKMGFRAVNILRGYYEDTPEDAYLMQYRRCSDNTTQPSIARAFQIIANLILLSGLGP
jgi:ribosomal-protein-alanine N-acetyltransferase